MPVLSLVDLQFDAEMNDVDALYNDNFTSI